MKFNPKLRSATKFNPLLMLLYALIIGLAGYIIIVSRAAPPPPTMYLTPAAQNLAINTTFTVDIRENSGTSTVNAAQANLTYPLALVDFVSMDTTNTAFTTIAITTGANGQITFAGGTAVGAPAVTGDQLMARVTFKTKTTGGNVSIAFASGSSMLHPTSDTTSAELLTSLSLTAGGSYTIDTTAPTVTLNTPANGAVISGGSTSSISVTAADNTGVSKVDILVDGVLKTTLTAAPYTYNWNTSGLALGSHTVQAVASDAYGNSASSATNTVNLTDQTAPTVSITSPTPGTTATGTLTVVATAADNSGGTGVTKVEFYVDGALKATDTASPYSFSWDSKTVTDGTHSLSAKAYDGASPANVATSGSVSVTVDNADHIPPTAPGGLTSPTQTTTSINLSWAASTDNVGVTGYRVQRNGTTIATISAITYADTGLTPGTSYNYSVFALDGNNNVSSPATLTASTFPLKQGDCNNDNAVTLLDLSLLLSNWAKTTTLCDFNHNNTVDLFDLSVLLSNYGK